MTLGSLFDGIGGWPLAAIHADVEPVWCSEIEPFPQAVTKRHFPKMEQLGDITKIDGTQIAPVDIVTIGSPCQDLSIAGKRKGLNGERSGLFRTAIDIVRAMRRANGKTYPRFVVWENVPGAFSSNKGNDFRAVLEEITESQIPMPESGRWAKAGMVRSNGCEVAWRTLDAQYWGVPQRRKRIFLVADFGGGCAAEILFKPEGMSGHIAAGGGKRKESSGSIKKNIGAAGLNLGTGLYTMQAFGEYCDCGVSSSLKQRDYKGATDLVSNSADRVRRLVPTECERLQGLPDGYTLIDDKACSDSARYKALGNGMAQPCADFVIWRIAEVA